MIIGITGKSGSGKSYLSTILAEKLQAEHIDVDKISHQVLSFPETQKFLKKEFGNDIYDEEILNRKKLGKIVFCDHDKLNLLNKFCKIQIEKKLDEIIKTETKPLILDYALLPWLKQFKLCDVKILLTADFETRYNRVNLRKNITKEYFKSRDNSVENYNEKFFDYVYKNLTQKSIDELIENLI